MLPKLMIFDCDGVVSDTAVLHFESWKEMMKLFDIDLPFEYIDRFRGIAREKCLEILKNDYNNILFDKYSESYLLDYKNKLYLKKIDNGEAKIYKKTVDLIINAKELGIKIGLASASKNSKKILEKSSLLSYFDYIADPNKIVNSKPDPEIFLNVSKQAKCKPLECIGFEDAEAGVKSIKSAGMFCVGIGPKSIMNEADIFFENVDKQDLNIILNKYKNFAV